MTKRSKLVLIILSSLVLVLVLLNIFVALGNQSIQAEVSERQQIIAQTIQLESLNRQLINVLANLALKTNDEQLKKVLAASGIDLSSASDSPAAKK